MRAIWFCERNNFFEIGVHLSYFFYHQDPMSEALIGSIRKINFILLVQLHCNNNIFNLIV